MTPKRLADLCAPDFIQKHRGEWRIGDMYYYPRQAETEGHNGIRFINAGYGEGYNKEPCCPDVAIWLPRAIDPFHPERGLWGMVDWEKFDLFKSLTANIFTICCISDFAFKFASRCITLALLKALAYQWRVEVEG